ncbi:MAG: propionyl-CoA carboxylase, partial [Desulfotignum sp.]|nr:propionyl-CoA carboxylase [Desulfotignum sp.]
MTDNKMFWQDQEQELEKKRQAAVWPGGQKAVEALAKRGKRPVRELITDLIDPDTMFFELSMLAGFGMGYPGVEDVPCAGIVTGIGKIHGNWTMIMANDSRVKAGT